MNPTCAVVVTAIVMQLSFAGPAWSLESVGPKEAKFDAIDGKPCILTSGSAAPGNALDLKNDEIVHFRSGMKLSYELTGNDNTLKLGGQTGRGTKWIVKGTRNASIQAAEGQFQGWYLDWSEPKEQVDANGQKRLVSHLILVEKPNTKFHRYPVAK